MNIGPICLNKNAVNIDRMKLLSQLIASAELVLLIFFPKCHIGRIDHLCLSRFSVLKFNKAHLRDVNLCGILNIYCIY